MNESADTLKSQSASKHPWNINGEPAYDMILIEFGDDINATIDLIALLSGQTREAILERVEHPPCIIMHCVGESFVRRGEAMLNEIGAKVEISLAGDCD